MKLEYIGMDSWDRPVYKDENGKLWKDVDPRKHRDANMCTSVDNAFDGEPDVPMYYVEKYRDVKIEFIPKRITW